MRKKLNPVTICLFLAALLMSAGIGACTKMDHFYKDHVISRTFTGKPDSIWVQTGNQRVKVSWLTPKDPAAANMVIYWNNRSDSVQAVIDPALDTNSIIIKDLQEGDYIFNAYTTDGKGNRSLIMELSTKVFGEVFQSTLRERDVDHSVVFPDSTVLLWKPLQSETLLGTEVEFTDNEGKTQLVFTPSSETQTVLKGANANKPVTIRTVYRPTATAFDKFYTDDLLVNLPEKELHSLRLYATAWDNTDYIDFNLVQVFSAEEVPEPKAGSIDVSHTRGAGSKHNFITINSDKFSVFTSDFQAIVNAWPTRNVSTMTYIGGGSEANAAYDALDANDRVQMASAFADAKSAFGETDRLTLLETGDIVYIHSVDRNIYIAMKVVYAEPDGIIDIEFKISRP